MNGYDTMLWHISRVENKEYGRLFICRKKVKHLYQCIGTHGEGSTVNIILFILECNTPINYICFLCLIQYIDQMILHQSEMDSIFIDSV